MTTDRNDQTTMFQAVGDTKPADNASIHRIVANVSPMKKSSMPHFDATLCDGEDTVELLASRQLKESDLQTAKTQWTQSIS